MSVELNGHELPINKRAAMSTAKGIEFKPEYKLNPLVIVFDNPPKMKPWLGSKRNDLTGLKYSRLTVVGYYGGKRSSNGTLWVVRCVCGKYELKRSKTIRRAYYKGLMARCAACDRFARCKQSYDRVKFGYDAVKDIEEY